MIKQSLASQIDQKEITKGIFRLMKTVEEHNKKITEYKSDSFNYNIEDLPNEEWRYIKNFGDRYQVSNLGRIKRMWFHSTKTYRKIYGQKILKQELTKGGYLRVQLYSDKISKHYSVHRLVAIEFIPVPKELLDQGYTIETLQVNHKNEIKIDNRIENLEWCTSYYNLTYGTSLERIMEQLRYPVSQFDPQGNFIRSYSCIQEAERITNINASTIRLSANHSSNSAGGYLWEYTTEEHKDGYKLPENKLRPIKLPNTAISQFDLEGNYLRSFDSIKEVEELLNISHSVISSCIGGSLKTAGGFIWKYYQDIHIPGYKLPLEEIFYQNTRRPYGSKAIKISDKTTGELIKYCNSLEQASKFLEICPTSIKKIIKRNGIYRHYKLEYITD